MADRTTLKAQVQLHRLHRAELPWKPFFMCGPGPRCTLQNQEVENCMLSILNKVTPKTLNTLLSQAQNLPVNTRHQLAICIILIYNKAIDEPMYCAAYAQMCKVLSGMQGPAQYKTSPGPEFVNFHKLIVVKCQAEFEKNVDTVLNKDAKLIEINLQTDAEKKKELMAIFEEEERKRRMKSVGNIRFICELFKLQMINPDIMHRCIGDLLAVGDDERLECLCKLLTTIGKDLEMKAQYAGDLGQYFSKMRDIANRRSGPGTVSSRVRFMLQDVIELCDNKWIPRRDGANRNTMDHIKGNAEKENLNMHKALSTPQTPAKRQNDNGGRDMGDSRRKGRNRKQKERRDTNQQGSNSLTNVHVRTNRNIEIDSSKLEVDKTEYDTVQFDTSTNLFYKWSYAALEADEMKLAQTCNHPYNVLQDLQVSGDHNRGSAPPTALFRVFHHNNEFQQTGVGLRPDPVETVTDLEVKVKDILLKLTTETLPELLPRIRSLPITSNEEMLLAYYLVFAEVEACVTKRRALAEILDVLSHMPSPRASKVGYNTPVSFLLQVKLLIIQHCYDRIEENKKDLLDREAKLKNVSEQDNIVQEHNLYRLYRDEERRIRLDFVEYVEYWILLFQRDLLTAVMMYRCIYQLLSSGDNVSLMCLCRLFRSIGEDLDKHAATWLTEVTELNDYYKCLMVVAIKSASLPLRQAAQDVLKLRLNDWLPEVEVEV